MSSRVRFFRFLETFLPPASFDLFGVALEVRTDDPLFLDELRLVLGVGQRLEGYALPRREVRLRVDAEGANGGGTLLMAGDDLDDPVRFLLSFGSATIPLRGIEGRGDAVALGDSDEPLFVFQGESAWFRRVPRWRRILANFVMLRLLRLRSEFLFFHAASVGVDGAGVMLVGPKGTGKSTLSLALAARGHTFFGDEMAVYNPADGMLLPFRRPVGIKPGPRASAIEPALLRTTTRTDEEGMLRIPIADVLEVADAAPAPLRSVIFLQGFGVAATMQKIDAGREELSSMQPIATSLQEGTKVSRVFEMIRLLSRCRCYRLTAAGPDETAAVVERELRATTPAAVDGRIRSV